MIEIPQNSIALNSHDVPGTKYDMWETWNVPAASTGNEILSKAAILAICSEGGLKCLVINCHGFYDHGINKLGTRKAISSGGFGLGIGAGIDLSNVYCFSQIKGLVKCIILVACGVVQQTFVGINGDGSKLCSEIARASGAYVIAPRIKQLPRFIRLPKNHIDNFEGEVVRYNPSGGIDDSRFLGRKLIYDIF